MPELVRPLAAAPALVPRSTSTTAGRCIGTPDEVRDGLQQYLEATGYQRVLLLMALPGLDTDAGAALDAPVRRAGRAGDDAGGAARLRGRGVASRTLTADTTAEAYLELLKDRGIDVFLGNAGTDFASLVEAFARFEAEGRRGAAAAGRSRTSSSRCRWRTATTRPAGARPR